MSFKSIYDLPLRIFHWMFVILFVLAFTIPQIVDDDSPVFAYHMIAGVLLGGAVFFRILWGFVGTPYSRFSNFALKPSDLLRYFQEISKGGARFWAGHNPASSWAGLGMLLLSLGLLATGLLMVFEVDKFLLVDIHEVFAFGFLGLALCHIGGITLHTIMHKDWIGMSMLHGKKLARGPVESQGGSKPVIAMIFLAVMLAFAGALVASFDEATGRIKLFGRSVQLLELDAASEAPYKKEG